MCMNRETMRYPKLEQTITAAECMLETRPDEIAAGARETVEKNLSEMRRLDAEIKSIPYDGGSDEADRINAQTYARLESQARKLCDATAKLLWPPEE